MVEEKLEEMFRLESNATKDQTIDYWKRHLAMAKFQPWFHGELSGSEADKLLSELGQPDDYLIRISPNRPYTFVLCIRRRFLESLHFKIHVKDGYVKIGLRTFDTLRSLISHYKKNPFTVSHSQGIILNNPIPKISQ
uniref:SH2 domain-containing protein n=1 Tax=Caenorhabditis tropicalis TaxID=1561998 RepID=A0A1I7TIJ4_9PELO